MSFKAIRRVVGAALGLGAIACGADFQPSADVAGLRVFGVVVDTPYAKPGTQPKLSIVYYDNSPRAVKADGTRRDVQILWLGGCVNPLGDQYVSCYPSLAASLSSIASASGGSMSGAAAAIASLPPGTLGLGDTFTANIPGDVITSRPAPRGTTPYGLSFVFWYACGGTIGFDAANTSGVPLKCTDDAGAALGPDDWVLGYTPIYAYDQLTDANPVITGGLWNGGVYAGTSCAKTEDCPADLVCGDQNLCIPVVPHCASDHESDCPGYQFKPVMDPSIAELDPNAVDENGKTLEESIWVLYYATDGTFSKDARLVNDPTVGWNDDYGTNWHAPGTTAGEVRIWGIVHDNRGGTGVWFQDVMVQ